VLQNLNNRKIVLLSGSPRRQEILNDAGFTFDIQKTDIDEDFPAVMPVNEVAAYLARKKAESFKLRMTTEIAIAADTTVVMGSNIMNKPADRDDAIRMLELLSGKKHTVITGVCIISREKEVLFDDRTEVSFRSLTRDEITWYIDRFNPYDKAGAYGVQEWIGMVAIDGIAGSYYNVVGLPIHRVYEHLANW
jgi:septum formation protein